MSTAPASRILVVEDDRDSRELLVELLSLHGLDARGARDGLVALELVEAFAPDLVLLDLSMPRLSGFEVARRVKQALGPRAPRIVAVTAFTEPEIHDEALAAGCEAVLVKPVPPDRLLEVVKRPD